MTDDVLSIIDPEREVVLSQTKNKRVTVNKGRHCYFINTYDKEGKMTNTESYTSFDLDQLRTDISTHLKKK